jgi:hypothetical protein
VYDERLQQRVYDHVDFVFTDPMLLLVMAQHVSPHAHCGDMRNQEPVPVSYGCTRTHGSINARWTASVMDVPLDLSEGFKIPFVILKCHHRYCVMSIHAILTDLFKTVYHSHRQPRFCS